MPKEEENMGQFGSQFKQKKLYSGPTTKNNSHTEYMLNTKLQILKEI